MKKIVIVKLGNACNPEVNSLEDVLEFMRASHTDDTCGCEGKSKKKSDESGISKEALDLISTIAEDLGIDVEQLKKDIIEEKRKAEAEAKKAAEAAEAKALFDKLEEKSFTKIHGEAKAKEEAAAKTNKSKHYTAYETGIYETGAIDGYEKGFKDAIEFIKSRLNKSITTTLSDLNDMAKWNFKDGTLKEDAVFKK